MNDWPPKLNIGALPADEQDIARNMVEQFFGLATYANDFRAALGLFDFCNQQLGLPGNQRVDGLSFDHLRFIAAREGAMCVYHFGKTIESIFSHVGRCPTLFAKLDRSRIRDARKKLRAAFPYFEAVRHAVAHMAELTDGPVVAKENAVIGPYKFAGLEIPAGATVSFRNVLQDRQYLNTFDGKIQAYEISQTTYDEMVDIRRTCYSVFEKASEP